MVAKDIIKNHISVHPDIQHGKPCIKGTRTPIHIVLEALAMGMSFKTLQEEFSPITLEDIRACILYAAYLAEEELITQ